MWKVWDGWILFSFLALFLLGETVIVSVNVVPRLVESYGNLSIYKKPLMQVAVFLFGFFLATSLAKMDYRRFLNGAIPYLLASISILSLLAVLIKKLLSGKAVDRWLLGSSLQPLEFVKISLVLFLAFYIVKKGGLRQWKHFIWAFALSFFVAILLLLQPDRGGALFILLISLLMIYVGGVPKKVYFLILPITLLFFLYALTAKGYVAERFSAWKDPFLDPEDSGYQIIQSLYALARGGFLGVGLGQGLQKMGQLPASDTDYVIAIIGEELGFLGVLTVIFLYTVLVLRLLWHSIKTQDPVGKLILFGTAMNFALSFFWNMAMVSNLIPPKGIALPFLSYGSSNLLASLIFLGIAQSVVNHKESTSFSLSRTSLGSILLRHA
ncbi:MAG: FtsW/RodA/SpoVE family cell cycle protein [Aquificaceae bacterium]|nr:FtsW/RodA/SpoVE family cell cycle protein [Aquificaceae bacterium]